MGFYGNLYHERILRGIRAKSDKISDRDKKKKDSTDKTSYDVRIVDGRVYMIPRGGLFEYILFPHVCQPYPLNIILYLADLILDIVFLRMGRVGWIHTCCRRDRLPASATICHE